MAKNKSRLGRGLSSLLSVSEDTSPPAEPTDAGRVGANENLPLTQAPAETAAEGELFHVELSRVTANPHQPRRTFDAATLAGLAESLKRSGPIQPIVVRAMGSGYELVAGERRWRAAQIAGLTHLPALLRHVDAAQQAELALVENIHRADLNPIERALAYQNLQERMNLTQEALAQRLGEDRSGVANHLRLLDLCGPARGYVAAGVLTLGHAKLLAGVQDLLLQHQLADAAVAEQLSVRALEQRVQTDRPRRTARPPGSTPHIADLERRISRELSMRVQVRQAGSKGRGTLVIHYGSLDQFDDLIAKLGVRADE